MNKVTATLVFLFFITAPLLQADELSELRAEIIGEQAGKAIATDHTEYQPDKAKEECKAVYYKIWEDHFKEQGFSTGEGVVNSFVKGCMNKYGKKFGK